MPRGSWYSQLPPFGWFDPEDRPGSAAYQVGGRSIPDSQQGIALPTRGGLGKWYNVTPPGSDRPMPFQQTDIGPASWTGRGVDISAAAAHQMGYNPKNFPTDANFKVEPIDTTGLGLAAGYMGGIPGQNDTAVAEGPPQQRQKSMPQSLMDMFQPQDAAGQPVGFGDALTSRSNSLIGLGLGLLQPSNPLRGESTWGNALQGYMGGAGLDARTAAEAARLKHQKSQDARQAMMDRFNMGMQERQFDRSGESDFAKYARDQNIAPGTPEYIDAAKKWALSKQEGDWAVQTDENTGQKFAYNKRTNETRPIRVPDGTATAGGNPYGPVGKMTTDEGKTALFADRAATAHAAITKAENINAEPGGTIGAMIQQNLPAGAANVLVSGERGKAMDAQRAFINALLRRESGAAINAGEFTSYSKEYFPQLGDTSDQIEGKRKHRAEVIAGLARESGKGYRPTYSFDEKGNIKLGAPTYAGKGGSTPTASAPPAEGKTGDPLTEAQHAIRMGAPRAAVEKRLRENGIDPSGL